MPEKLALNTLEQAVTLHQPGPNLIAYAGRSHLYTSTSCQQRITDAGGLGNPCDKAQVRVDWSTLKAEWLSRRTAFANFEKPAFKSVTTTTSTSTTGIPPSVTATP